MFILDRRLQLDAALREICSNIYFQPPEDVKLNYPCIIYNRGTMGKTEFADDIPYLHRVRYDVVVVDWDPDSPLREKIASLPTCIFQRHYTKDNLNHDMYNLYY